MEEQGLSLTFQYARKWAGPELAAEGSWISAQASCTSTPWWQQFGHSFDAARVPRLPKTRPERKLSVEPQKGKLCQGCWPKYASLWAFLRSVHFSKYCSDLASSHSWEWGNVSVGKALATHMETHTHIHLRGPNINLRLSHIQLQI